MSIKKGKTGKGSYTIKVTSGNQESLKSIADEMRSQVDKFNEEARKAQATMQILRLQQQGILRAILDANEAPKDMQFKLSEDFTTLTAISEEELEALAANSNNVLHQVPQGTN